jgi:hypothetical protein
MRLCARTKGSLRAGAAIVLRSHHDETHDDRLHCFVIGRACHAEQCAWAEPPPGQFRWRSSARHWGIHGPTANVRWDPWAPSGERRSRAPADNGRQHRSAPADSRDRRPTASGSPAWRTRGSWTSTRRPWWNWAPAWRPRRSRTPAWRTRGNWTSTRRPWRNWAPAWRPRRSRTTAWRAWRYRQTAGRRRQWGETTSRDRPIQRWIDARAHCNWDSRDWPPTDIYPAQWRRPSAGLRWFTGRGPSSVAFSPAACG